MTNSAERTLNSRIIRNRDFAAGGAQHHVHWGQCPLQEIDPLNWLFIHYFTLQTLIWAHSGINSNRCNRYWREDTQLYAKKYGVLSRPGYLNRCMHSNNMCSPNSVFLSVEENEKRFVIEDKWRLERTSSRTRKAKADQHTVASLESKKATNRA